MEVTGSFLADYAKADATNKVNALGVFNYTEADEYPALMPHFYWVVVLNAERSEITSPMVIDLSLSGGTPGTEVFRVRHEVDVDEVIGSGQFVTSNMVFGFTTLVLPAVGRYVFEIRANDQAQGQTILYATTPVEEKNDENLGS